MRADIYNAWRYSESSSSSSIAACPGDIPDSRSHLITLHSHETRISNVRSDRHFQAPRVKGGRRPSFALFAPEVDAPRRGYFLLAWPVVAQGLQRQAPCSSPPPTATDSISEDPILFLPPLLSPLPSDVKHEHPHPHQGPLEEVLSNFETRLPNIDPASLDLHQALHNFAPYDDEYASRPYDEAFNWETLNLPEDVSREWYCVVFRSRRKPESSSLSLYQADREAHEEAVRNGGLVMYWYGVPDHTGLNLATCIWQSRRHAVKAIGGPKHMLAMKQAKDAYEIYELERWVLRKEPGTTGLTLDRWQGGEVGW